MVFPPLFLKMNGLGNISVNNKHCRYIPADIASNATQIKMKIICKIPNKTLKLLMGGASNVRLTVYFRSRGNNLQKILKKYWQRRGWMEGGMRNGEKRRGDWR
jgi:hypothetical protein